jgi:hypothetical protein
LGLDWELGLDEEMYNLQSEPTFYNPHPAFLFHHIAFMILTYIYIQVTGTCIYFARVTDNLMWDYKFNDLDRQRLDKGRVKA